MAKDVLCEVNNCTFWKKGNKCSAEQIYVVSHTGETADDSKETDCKTFEPHGLEVIRNKLMLKSGVPYGTAFVNSIFHYLQVIP
jgi:hypothetical protein